ncbi:MAG: thiol peroxidase [Bacteroidales bacterium]|nr:thiol peroxidase [Bacteroidales bacterium]
MKENKNITSKRGTPLTLLGEIVKVGDIAPNFNAVNINGERVKLSDFKGKSVVITVFPAINTPVCSMQAREFNKRAAAANKDVVILGISKDDISDSKRFCISEGINNMHILSDKKYEDFGVRYGFEIKELGLLARGTVIISKDGRVVYAEYVPDIADEPAYDEAFKIVEKLK